jgi:hypothetical protein
MKISKKTHNKLISAWREQVMETTKGKCISCGSKATDAHHVCSKGSSSWVMEYAVENGAPMCHECHMALHAGVDSKRVVVEDFVERTHGITVEFLRFKSKQAIKKDKQNIDFLHEVLGI